MISSLSASVATTLRSICSCEPPPEPMHRPVEEHRCRRFHRKRHLPSDISYPEDDEFGSPANTDQICAHLPEPGCGGLVVADLGGCLGFAVGEVAAGHLFQIRSRRQVD